MTDGPLGEGVAATDVVRLTMPARAEYLILARLALAGIAREVAMSADTLADLKLAVTEACGNAVRHAYPADGADGVGTVHVVYEVGPESIEITVEDEGSGVTLEALPDDPLADEDLGGERDGARDHPRRHGRAGGRRPARAAGHARPHAQAFLTRAYKS